MEAPVAGDRPADPGSRGALRNAEDLVPNYLLDIIRTGEMSGNLGTSLDHFASLLEEEAFAKATQQFVAILMGGQIFGIVLMLRAMFP